MIRVIRLFILPTLVLASCAAAVHGSAGAVLQEPTCAWDPVELDGELPVTVRAIQGHLARPEEIESLLDGVSAWIRECDDGEARRVIAELRRRLGHDRTNDALKAILGIVIARGPEIRIPGAAGLANQPAHRMTLSEDEAVRLLTDVIRDKQWPAAAEELGRLALSTRDEKTLGAARAGLEIVTSADPNSGLWSLLAAVDLAVNDAEAAVASAEVGLRNGEAQAARLLGVARMLTESSPDSGAALYMNGISAADRVGVQLYFDDLSGLLSRSELSAWSQLSADEKTDWLRAAWTWRASISTLPVAERLAEHFRRLMYVRRHHWRQSYRGARPMNALWTTEYLGVSALDDPGIVYLRHGPPDEVMRLAYPGASRMAHFYRSLGGGRAVLEFDKDESWSDYYMPDPTSFCSGGSATAGRHGNPAAFRHARQSYDAAITSFLLRGPAPRVSQDNRCYGTIAGDVGLDHLLNGADLRRTLAETVLESETAVPRMKRPLDVFLNSYAFRGSRETELFTVVSIVADEIAPQRLPSGVLYSLRLFSAAENPTRRTVVRSDTILNLQLSSPIPAGSLLRFTAPLEVTGGEDFTLRASVRNEVDTLQGQVVSTVRHVQSFMWRAFSTSDIVIANNGVGPLIRGPVRLAPLPGHLITEDQAFRIYYELYGVERDEPLDVKIEITPGRAEGILARLRELLAERQAVVAAFQEPAEVTGDAAPVLRSVQAALKPGAYTVMITTRRVRTGEEVKASTTIIVKPEG